MRGWYFHCPSHHFVLNVSTLPRPFPWPKELTGKSIFNFTWGKSLLSMTGVPSSYHDKHGNSRRGSPWPPRNHERPVLACPDRLMTFDFWELFCFWRLLLFTASTIWTLTHWTLTLEHWLPGQCQLLVAFWLLVRNIGKACRTWRQFQGRWCLKLPKKCF